MDIVFARPQVLYLLIAVLLVGVIIANTFRWKERSRNALLDYSLVSVLLASVSTPRQKIKAVLVVASLFMLVVAMAQPQTAGAREVEAQRRAGADIVVVLDVSLSMAAEDVAPNRLERAKEEVQLFLSQLEGDRVGMVIYAANSTLRFPLTTDIEAARLLVNTTTINSAPVPGTEQAKGIRLATGILKQSETKDRFILLISDGENHSGDPMQAVQDAKEDGITIHTLGVGARNGVPIPVADERGRVSYKKDATGATVISRLDEGMLSRISSASGGNYINLGSSQNAAQRIYRGMAKTDSPQDKLVGTSGQLYQVVAFIALLLLFFEPLVSESRSKILDPSVRRAENE